MAEEDNKDNCESQRQTKSDKWQQLKGKLQETETQKTQNANDNPMVIGNNNKESIAYLSEVLISQNLIADAETKEDETSIGTQINCNSIDFLAESHIHHSSYIIEEEEDDTTPIGIQIDCNSVDFLEDLLISCNSPIFEEETKDTAAQNTTINNNNIESLIVDISTDVDKQAQTIQKKKGKWNKTKNLKAIGSNKAK